MSSQPGAETLAGPEYAADADYRYVLELRTGVDPQLTVQGWRRLPGSTTWHPLPGGSLADAPSSKRLPGS